MISLAGTDCRLIHLGMVAQITGGVVDIVDPSNLTDRFGNILSSRTLATDVTATLQLYHVLSVNTSPFQRHPFYIISSGCKFVSFALSCKGFLRSL